MIKQKRKWKCCVKGNKVFGSFTRGIENGKLEVHSLYQLQAWRYR